VALGNHFGKSTIKSERFDENSIGSSVVKTQNIRVYEHRSAMLTDLGKPALSSQFNDIDQRRQCIFRARLAYLTLFM
jgi:hypothetical protein